MSTTFGKCPHCPKEARTCRLWGEGVCLHHYRNPPALKEGKKAISKPSQSEVQAIVTSVVNQPTKKQLDAWFQARYEERPEFCEEPGCTCRLVSRVTWQIKSTICHIVPKRHFWSVALHPMNRVFMCKTPHHDDFDSSWDKAQQMAIWPVAVERFQQFMHLITNKELRYLPPALRELTKR